MTFHANSGDHQTIMNQLILAANQFSVMYRNQNLIKNRMSDFNYQVK